MEDLLCVLCASFASSAFKEFHFHHAAFGAPVQRTR